MVTPSNVAAGRGACRNNSYHCARNSLRKVRRRGEGRSSAEGRGEGLGESPRDPGARRVQPVSDIKMQIVWGCSRARRLLRIHRPFETSKTLSAMSYVDRKYNEHLDSLRGSERVQRTCDLLGETMAILEHQIRSQSPDLDENEVRLRVAEILYLWDEGAQRLIRIAREHG